MVRAHRAAIAEGNDDTALMQSQLVAVAQAHPALDFDQRDRNLIFNHLADLGQELNVPEGFETWLTQVWTMPAPPVETAQTSANTSG